MSLKAKLEAVIYAAEEPVTLNQLAALFAADALEWKAAQEAAAREQTAEVAGVPVAPDNSMPLLADGLEYLGLADTPAVYAEPGAQDATPAVEVAGAEPSEPAAAAAEPAEAGGAEAGVAPEATTADSEPGQAGEEHPAPASAARDAADASPVHHDDDAIHSVPDEAVPPAEAAETAGPVVDIESEARRLARQRDREVKAVLKQLLDELIASSEADGRGVEIREIAGGYRMATKPECHDAVRLFVKSLKPPMKLSLPALETLAVVAYKQPVTAPEVNEIRGVESAGVLGSLLARKLVATAGRKQVIGRPILYKTTREFLLRFGLKDLAELPSMEEFEKMAAIELEEPATAEEAAAAAEEAAEQAEGRALLAGADAAEPGGTETDPTAEIDELELLKENSPSGVEMAGAAEALQDEPAAVARKPAAELAEQDATLAGAVEDAPEETTGSPAAAADVDDTAASMSANETQPGREPGATEEEASRNGNQEDKEKG
jgi:segregation and condensation protein B